MLAQCSEVLPDGLSLLPDDILIYNILSLLPTEEAARTSILARRWRFLWLYVPSLDLDASRKVARTHTIEKGKKIGGRVASKYVEWVDRVIGTYRGSAALSRFCVRFCLDDTFSHKIDSWLNFALGKGVQVLELDCCQGASLDKNRYTFPSMQPHLFPNLRLLKSLSLKDVYITTDSLDHLLLECEFLERLHLQHVRSANKDLQLQVNVTGPMSRLKYIDISEYHSPVSSIMISAPTPDLVSFKYSHGEGGKMLHVEHAPRLVDMLISGFHEGFDLLSHPLFRYISQLQSLRLDIRFWDTVYRQFGKWSIISEESAHLHHQNLRVIEFVRFTGRKIDYGLAEYLIRVVVSLEKLTVDCRNPLVDEGLPCHLHINRVTEWKKRLLEFNQTLPSELTQMVPSKVELDVILPFQANIDIGI
ncbi:F-box/LRR-repeat protein At3g59200-like [Punica granatum]|uniref:F-box/LRR-repeat protein At3g59200-like n=1 Tax=Punica granatum TaxID=22663 RepID=A0A218WQ54_PUNGR|nr:F-box/LRR-repeat protein At3g59200-like [Punica granatum]OWM74598.1 hypothetical protein CDL15_Pgr005178 [Punica granatum]